MSHELGGIGALGGGDAREVLALAIDVEIDVVGRSALGEHIEEDVG